jgi:hypothetical protein
MAAPIVIPFNNNPSSISSKTASYTIPTGKYARVGNATPDLSVNGVLAGISRVFSISSSAVSATLTYGFTVSGTGFYVSSWSVTNGGIATTTASIGFGSTAGFNAVTISRVNSGSTNGTAFTRMMNEGYYSLTTTNQSTVQSMTSTIYALPTNYFFWAPSGTVLAGASFFIEEYNQIS